MLQSLDILILLVLAIGAVRGFVTGAVRQVVSFIGIVVSIVLAIELMSPVGRLVGDVLGVSEALQPALGLLAVFLIIQILLFFVVRAIESVVKTLRLSTVNRLLGSVAGVAKAALILSVIFIALAHLEVPEREKREESAFYAPIAGALPTAWDYVSTQIPRFKSLTDRLGENARQVLDEP